MSDVEVLRQLIDSMSEAVDKLEDAWQKNQIEEFNKIKSFILNLQKRIKLELAK